MGDQRPIKTMNNRNRKVQRRGREDGDGPTDELWTKDTSTAKTKHREKQSGSMCNAEGVQLHSIEECVEHTHRKEQHKYRSLNKTQRGKERRRKTTDRAHKRQ